MLSLFGSVPSGDKTFRSSKDKKFGVGVKTRGFPNRMASSGQESSIRLTNNGDLLSGIDVNKKDCF